MMLTISEHCYWDGMGTDILEFCRACITCAKDIPIPLSTAYRFVMPRHAFHTISIDVMGLIGSNPTFRGNRYIIVAVDHFSKWVEAKAIPSPTSQATAKFIISHVILIHGCPSTILTDNGSNFASEMVTSLNESMGIRDTKSALYHPETNRSVERVNGTLKSILSKAMQQVEHPGTRICP